MGYLRKDAPIDEIKKAIDNVLNSKRYMSPELSEKLLIDLHSNHNPENPFDNLSSREFEIVQHLANGDSVSEISKKLNLHTSTIGAHKGRIFEKLQCDNIIDLARMAKVQNIIIGS
jgi:two-component system invasion response regulator UvrY